MMSWRGGLFALLLAWAAPAFALDPGVAAGHYEQDGVRVEFTHAIALTLDNAEGVPGQSVGVRVLLSDREVPIDVLYGAVFAPATTMASRGELRGLLLEFDPANHDAMHVTVLVKPDDPRQSLANISLSNNLGLWRKLNASKTSVDGDYKATDGTDMVFTFSAPLHADPVVADLKGAAAQGSEQVRVLTARAQALSRGDMAAAIALSSRPSGENFKTASPEEIKEIQAANIAMLPQIKTIDHVVVRKATAVAMMGQDSWLTLIFEDGHWKAD